MFICPVLYSVNMSLKSVPEITTDVSAGIYNTAFHNPFAFTRFESISTAKSIGNGISNTKVKNIYFALFITAIKNTLSFKSFV